MPLKTGVAGFSFEIREKGRVDYGRGAETPLRFSDALCTLPSRSSDLRIFGPSDLRSNPPAGASRKRPLRSAPDRQPFSCKRHVQVVENRLWGFHARLQLNIKPSHENRKMLCASHLWLWSSAKPCHWTKPVHDLQFKSLSESPLVDIIQMVRTYIEASR